MSDETPKQLRLLFLDDDQEFLQTISMLFALWSQGEWVIQTANTGPQALAALEEESFDLIVVDLQMPVMDGVQFLGLLKRKHPALRTVVLTGQASPAFRDSCLAQGAELFLEKPTTSEGLETAFATLRELAALQPQTGFQGVLRQAGLQDILQMQCLGHNSSILEIINGQVRGSIYIEQGKIIHAELGGSSGEAAFHRLLCQDGGEFNLKPFEPPLEKTIAAQWEFLLMESARVRDELADLTSAGRTAAVKTAEAAPTGLPAQPEERETAGAAVRIQEFVVCSGQGEVLYDWQCRDAEARIKLFGLVAHKAALLSQHLPVGRFDRLELQGREERVVIVIAPDRRLFVRSNPASPEPANQAGAEP